jgi:hypothetical protein
VQQTPPLAGSELFPTTQNGGLPDWASAITVQLDNNHVQWLYKRDTYAMGFVVDRLGFVDAIVVAGIESPIARTQLEDPVHTVRLGDDLRKVLFRYGYPDTIETYPVNVSATAGTGGAGGAGGAPGGPPVVSPVVRLPVLVGLPVVSLVALLVLMARREERALVATACSAHLKCATSRATTLCSLFATIA